MEPRNTRNLFGEVPFAYFARFAVDILELFMNSTGQVSAASALTLARRRSGSFMNYTGTFAHDNRSSTKCKQPITNGRQAIASRIQPSRMAAGSPGARACDPQPYRQLHLGWPSSADAALGGEDAITRSAKHAAQAMDERAWQDGSQPRIELRGNSNWNYARMCASSSA
jgi:hypothetical protein